jgi:hypothetical protein
MDGCAEWSGNESRSPPLLTMPQRYRRASAILLAALVAMGAAISRRETRYELRLEISSSVSSEAQLFYDIGRGWTEQDSVMRPIVAASSAAFQQLSFPLPARTIYGLRFDPLNSNGRVAIKDVQVGDRRRTVRRFSPSDVQPLNQIASVESRGNQTEVSTTAVATDPSLRFVLAQPLSLKKLSRMDQTRTFAVGAAALVLLGFLSVALYPQFERSLHPFFTRTKSFSDALAARYSSAVLPLDSLAIWFGVFCLVLFLAASLLKLNGSSISFYSIAYRHGAHVKTWLGAPRALRSDEWAYHTPDVLSQAQRADRFAVPDSDLGPHSAALIGNVPVRDVSALFRPQFWAFFILPVEYGYAFFWQCKALFLIAGVFTWLLFLTRSTRWAIAGALWFFFSPFTQWSYSWPSALPEMIGLACFGTVLLCYLLVGQNTRALAASGVGFTICAVDFALCAYVPHMIPIAWLSFAVIATWCVAKRAQIVSRVKLRQRAIALGLSAVVICAVGIHVYVQLQQTLIAVSQTVYPGKRVVGGGAIPVWQLISHFMQWTEAEDHFPAAIGNLSEGSGFLWLAPFAALCLGRLTLDRRGRAALVGLFVCFLALLAWVTLPIPDSLGHLFALDKVPPPRATPALGLANVGIVALCAAHLRPYISGMRRIGKVLVLSAVFGAASLVFFATNGKLNGFFSRTELLCFAAFTSFLLYTFLAGQQIRLMSALVIANVIYFGNVNPIERGLTVITASPLFAYVQTHRSLLDGKWLVYSDSPVSTGFLASMGFQVYTGTRYCPDIDHFPLFRRYGLNTTLLNRLGYLDAHPLKAGETSTVTLENPVVVRWNVAPTSPILKQIGIKYVAFDSVASPVISEGLVPLAKGPVDGFWLYRIP